MDQPAGFVVKDMHDKVCRLKKFLYGLKHASKQYHEIWYNFDI